MPTGPKHPKRPRDLNQWAKRVVDVATGEIREDASSRPGVAKRLWEMRDVVDVLEAWEALPLGASQLVTRHIQTGPLPRCRHDHRFPL